MTPGTTELGRLKTFEGRTVGPPQPAPDPVNQPMIRHWCQAIGDTNPVYTDPDLAAATSHGGIIAPPAMLQAWVMRGPAPRPTEGGTAQDELLRLLDSMGYTSVVATNCDQEYERDLRPDDHLSMTTVIEAVSEEKKTALGAGHFVTTRSTYTDEHGDVVATMRFRILKFRPPEQAGRPPEQAERPEQPAAPKPAMSQRAAPRPRPVLTHDTAFWWEAVQQGRLLIQRCSSCGALRHPPGPMCGACRSLDWDTIEASGRGVVFSFVVNHHPQLPAFDYPLVVALVELEEGTRLVSDLVDCPPDEVAIGMPVQIDFVAVDDELTLPLFRRA